MKKILKNKFISMLIVSLWLVCCMLSVYGIFFPQNITYASTDEYGENRCYENASIAYDETLKENSQRTLSYVFNDQVKTTKSLHSDYQTNINFKLDEVSVILTETSSKEGFDENVFLNVQNIERIDGKETPTEADLNNNLYRQILTIKLEQGGEDKVFSAITELQNLEEVLVAEPLYEFIPYDDYVPNDPYYTQGEQWGLDDTYGIQASDAWDIYNDNRTLDTIKIGIFEDGIQLDHPDLTVGNSNFEPSNAKSEHGTHVAGIIGAKINNNIGIAGIASTEIYLLNKDKFVESLNWAEQNGIKIINASFSLSRPKLDDEGNVEYEATYSAAIEAAIANFNGLFITSAGNQNINNDLHPQYPAGYNSENIIVVGSINSNGDKSSFSNYGSATVDIFAPGSHILSTYPLHLCIESPNTTYATSNGNKKRCEVEWSEKNNCWEWNGTTHESNGYHFMSGTSMAAPHVTGVAALLMSINPHLTAEEIKERIIYNDTDIPNLSEACVSGGILNAYKALTEPPQVEEIFNNFGYEGSTFSWKGSVEMRCSSSNEILSDGMLIVKNNSNLDFRVKTISHSNAFLVTNGEIKFELINAAGEILQTNICTVKVDLLNKVTLTGDTYSIDTSQLDTGTYSIEMTSHFTRGTWTQDDSDTYTFAVNRPFTVMEGFGYNESLYKWNGKVTLSSDYLYMFNDPDMLTIMGDIPINFEISTVSAFNAWTEISGTVTLTLTDSAGNVVPLNGNNSHVSTVRVGLLSNASITNSVLSFSSSGLADGTYTLTLNCSMTRSGTTYNTSDTFSFKVHNEMCVSEGTLITLADGSQKAVEDLTGNEELLVWNMFTGDFDSAPVLFIDSDEQRFYQIVNLYFSDGTSVKVIGEHAFWNKDLNEYVFLRTDADQYIGDAFVKQTINENGEMVSSEAILTDVVVTTEYTTAWSPVTYGHLCYYVNGVLSMPGATEGLINIFDVDPDTMRYDDEAMNQDIATYGLFTYEEFNALIPVSEEIFNAFNGQYLKVAIGKGLTSLNELAMLIEKYEMLF